VKAADAKPPVEEGQVLADKYQVEKVLGTGGMGVVVAARHLQLGTRVAIKFLRSDACVEPETVTRFLREARAAARLQSEHVVRVTDVATLESGAPYMVMELLHGGDLARVLAARGHLPVEEAVLRVLEACDAVAEAHALGIVHRDLKPANIYLAHRADGTPFVKVLDFGVSKTVTAGAQAATTSGVATGTGASLGTPYYMSPEQIKSARAVDARTDVWSLGVVLYELLTGRRPFEAESLPAVFVVIANDPPAPLRKVRPEVPAALEQVVLACLEKEPAKRVQSIGELARRLAPFAPRGAEALVERVQRLSRGHTLQQALDPTMPAPTADKLGHAATERAWGASATAAAGPRDRRMVVIAGGVLAVVVVAFALALPRMLQGPAQRPSPSVSASVPVSPSVPAAASANVLASASASAAVASASVSASAKPMPAPAPPRVPRKKDDWSPTPN
jgi:serine/threonine protein kinase